MIIERQTQAVTNSGIETAGLNTIRCTWDSRFLCVLITIPLSPFSTVSLFSRSPCWTKCKSKEKKPGIENIKENYVYVMRLFYSPKSYIKGERDTIIYYSTCYQLGGHSGDNGHDIEQPGRCTMFSTRFGETRGNESGEKKGDETWEANASKECYRLRCFRNGSGQSFCGGVCVRSGLPIPHRVSYSRSVLLFPWISSLARILIAPTKIEGALTSN